MIVVIDQFRPDYVERFDMANVRALMDGGINFERALVQPGGDVPVLVAEVQVAGGDERRHRRLRREVGLVGPPAP